MTVTVNYTTQVKAALGVASETVQLDEACTVAELIQRLANEHGETFRSLVLDAQGRLLPSILLSRDSDQINFDDPVKLADGQELTILSAISGG